ncbi:L-serine ammonia-lyase, iron-sulfur-dependent, subunit alpha [bacterium]|nr:L-serine ammonia-lyase, iron-sulfur-dependent, subunit alpha [bacterium]
MNQYPSIFNDVMGPVMRGPSSSHCAASLRIGRICRDLADEKLEDVLIEFDPNGSLATTHKSQGSDMGLFGGFLGWEANDERLADSESALEAAGIRAKIEITDIHADHPNTYQLTLTNAEETHRITAISTGGGMIEVIAIDGNEVSMAGDFFETVIYVKSTGDLAKIKKFILDQEFTFDDLILHDSAIPFIEIKSQQFPGQELLKKLQSLEQVTSIKKISPVLPVLSRKGIMVPFITCEEMLVYNQDKHLPLWELAAHYESARGSIPVDEVIRKMTSIVHIMQDAIDTGLRGTKYDARILGAQSVNFKKQLEDHKLIGGDTNNLIIMYVSAVLEVKSSMGVIVAAPTAGSCGVVPGAVIGTAKGLGKSEDEIVKAMLVAGLIGVFISAHATFAAEVGGCMAECGSGSGMAAAAIVSLVHGTLEQSISAASVALQNSFGMICDPVANRVEAPCLGKNVMAATNALSCANMSLAQYDHVVPLDEVIQAMNEVGNAIPNTLRCTSLGGLSTTKTSKALEEKMNKTFYKIC